MDRDGEIDRAGRVALVDVAPDRARGMNCDGEVVVLDQRVLKQKKSHPWSSNACEEDHSERKTEVLVHLDVEEWIKGMRSEPDAT